MTANNDLECLRNAITRDDGVLCIGLQEHYCEFVPDTMAPLSVWKRKQRTLDTLSELLIPDDIPANLKPRKITGNGNCLFNSVSVLLVGNEDLVVTLSLLTAAELYLHQDFYANHPR